MKPRLAISCTEYADPAIALPAYETNGAAGMDIRVNFPSEMRDEGVLLAKGARALLPTGMKFEIPMGFEVQIRPRSGLALKHGVTVLNSPGTIDSDYRGEVGVILINHGNEPIRISHGERIAQMVVCPVIQCEMVEVDELTKTARGAGGFGSTGRA